MPAACCFAPLLLSPFLVVLLLVACSLLPFPMLFVVGCCLLPVSCGCLFPLCFLLMFTFVVACLLCFFLFVVVVVVVVVV